MAGVTLLVCKSSFGRMLGERNMMSDRFWVFFWSLAAVVIIYISAGLVYINVSESDKLQQQRYVKCIESGGSWIPSYRNDAICLRK